MGIRKNKLQREARWIEELAMKQRKRVPIESKKKQNGFITDMYQALFKSRKLSQI